MISLKVNFIIHVLLNFGLITVKTYKAVDGNAQQGVLFLQSCAVEPKIQNNKRVIRAFSQLDIKIKV